jgi:hypothetical protein
VYRPVRGDARRWRLDERLAARSAATGRRRSCLRAATGRRHRSIGFDECRGDRGGRRADLVTVPRQRAHGGDRGHRGDGSVRGIGR